MKAYLLLSRMHIHNANAMSSTITIGVPAMTAWLGAVHALERKTKEKEKQALEDVGFKGVAVSYHKADLQVYKGAGDYVNSIIGTANPLDKNGERPPFIGEPRIHLLVSLLIEVKGVNGDNIELFEQTVKDILPRIKMAGGDILDIGKIKVMFANQDKSDEIKKVIFSLAPGWVPIERTDLMEAEGMEGEDGLDRLLHYLKVHGTAEKDEFGKVKSWKYERETGGWLVPIAIGFKGLSPLGKVKNQRDPDTPHRFAETIVTLGEFKMVHRFKNIDEMMWHYVYEENNQLYLCKNNRNQGGY